MSFRTLTTLGFLFIAACGSGGVEGDSCEVDDDCEGDLHCHVEDDAGVCEEDEHDHEE